MSVWFLPGGRRRHRTAFVLGGGGNLGAVQVGMLQALVDRGIVPDVVLGCSVGALNGAALAGEPTPAGLRRLAEYWATLRGSDLVPVSGFGGLCAIARRGQGLAPIDSLRRIIADMATFERFEDAAIPLQVVATSLETGDERWFSSGSIVEPILASAALPAVYPPVEIDGTLHVDGAVVNNVPISRAVEIGAERVYVCHVGNFSRPRPAPKRPIDVLLHSFAVAREHRFRTDIARSWPGVELIVLPGIDPGTLRRNDFRRTSELVRRGRETTARFLERIEPNAALA